ncbi:HNH endonuclease [Arthrobacter sp. 35W]|uniref:HNH endonuclease n=1 Tax=Arthrobacter sp. 35W TaxID=1132441 RepID=UPI0004255BBB|nr:HNH endonuclease [Arthrobacter sp. 35W]
MRYWWASQGRNYETAIEEGTLWSCPEADGSLPDDRASLKEMKQGDIVFHYFGPYVRAVSVVAEEWQDFERPSGYEQQEGESNKGWLVRVYSIATGLQIHRDRAAALTASGEHNGPFNEAGKPQHRYLTPLSDEEGKALLAEAGVSAPLSSAGSLRGLPGDVWGVEEDDPGMTTIRVEQAHLRKHLLRGRQNAPCSICGEDLPARLLIAGHIKPRGKCTEEERMDHERSAMLICALGCDALYEWGYIIVGEDGRIHAGQPAETKRIQDAVDVLVGHLCSAFNDHTAENFAENSRLMLAV